MHPIRTADGSLFWLIMMFKDLKIGDNVFILENAGTFRKVNTYNIGTVTYVGQQYDDMSNTNPYMNS